MKNRRVEIVDANVIVGRLEANIIGGAVSRTAIYTAAGYPNAKPVGPVITPRRLAVALRNWKTSEFPTPDNQRRIQEPALLQDTFVSRTPSQTRYIVQIGDRPQN